MKNITILLFLLSPAACTALPEKIEKIRKIRELINDGPAPVISEKDLENLDPYLLAAPILLAAVWMTFAYLRERKS